MDKWKKSLPAKFPKKLDRRTTILLTLLGLLMLSSYANYRLGLSNQATQTSLPVIRLFGAQPTAQPTPQPEAGATQPGVFSDYRLQRSASRTQELTMLDEMIADTTSGGEMAEQARAQKLALVKSMEQETTLEGLLKAKGFADVVVSAKSGTVTVVVKQVSLTSAEATQILELTTKETGAQPRDVKIIPTK